MIYTSCVSTVRATEAGIFIPTTVFLHNTPLSIHGHAAHKKKTFLHEAKQCMPYSTFLFFPLFFIVFPWVSFFLLPSTFSKSERRPPPPCHIHLSVMNGRLRRTQQQSLSINVLSWLALFYPKAKTFRPVLSASCVWASPRLALPLVLLCRGHDVRPRQRLTPALFFKCCLRS